MASPAKIAANRANATASTGPRGAAAKARTRKNALCHGLGIPRQLDERTADKIGDLARALCAHSLEPDEQELALRAAEAEFEMRRVRRTRSDMINQAMRQLRGDDLGCLSAKERASLAFAKKSKILAACDRYERRAGGRRNQALRRLQRLKDQRDKEWGAEVGPPVSKQALQRPLPFEQLFIIQWLDVTTSMKGISAGARNAHVIHMMPAPLRQFSAANISMRVEVEGNSGRLELTFDLPDEPSVKQTFEVVHTPSRIGRGRWFVLCPHTQKKVRALYLVEGERRFWSRHALGLTYRSRYCGPSEAHAERRRRLLQRLGGEERCPGPVGHPPRPKHMHHATYYDICDKISRHELLSMCVHIGLTDPEKDPNWPSWKKSSRTRGNSPRAIGNRQSIEDARTNLREDLSQLADPEEVDV